MKGIIYSVGQLNGYVKRLFERDAFLSDVFVEGEISNLTLHRSGHIYFSLKDKNAQIGCVMFQTYTGTLKFMPETGMKVTAYGSVSLYEKTGAYRLYVKIMEPAGAGALYEAFEKLKKKLEGEGIFDPAHKKKIPEFPKTIGVLTSPTGAAVRDIISVARRRNPSVSLVICPVSVQGINAADTIVKALNDVNEWKGCDLIILGRGGGSVEDLWAFNEEKVAYAIYNSEIPIISAVGHESDFTIADFVSDLRAATPSAAAELAVHGAYDDKKRVFKAYKSIELNMTRRLSSAEATLKYAVKFFSSDRLLRDVCNMEGYGAELLDKLYLSINRKIGALEARLEKSVSLTESLSPLKVLQRGYSIITDDKGDVVISAESLSEGGRVNLRLKDGSAKAEIKNIYLGEL